MRDVDYNNILPCVNVLPVVVDQRVESLDDLLVLAEGEKRVLVAPLPDLVRTNQR